jgi:uncharacterized repeat protein (TIGR04076 family)
MLLLVKIRRDQKSMTRPFKIKNPKARLKRPKDSFQLYDLLIETHSDGKRPMICNHPVGSHFFLSGENLSLPPGQPFPVYALAAILILLPAKQRVTTRHDWMSTDAWIACPDPLCGGLFFIKRLKKRTFYHHQVSGVKPEQPKKKVV